MHWILENEEGWWMRRIAVVMLVLSLMFVGCDKSVDQESVVESVYQGTSTEDLGEVELDVESEEVSESVLEVASDKDTQIAFKFKDMVLDVFDLLDVQVVSESGMFSELEYVELDETDRAYLGEIGKKVSTLFDLSTVYLKFSRDGSEEDRAGAIGQIHVVVSEIQEMEAGRGLNVMYRAVGSIVFMFGNLIDEYDASIVAGERSPEVEKKIVGCLNLFKSVLLL
jgi:hypothetical protein